MQYLSLTHLLSFSLGALCTTITALLCLRRWKKSHLFYELPRLDEVHRTDPRPATFAPIPERTRPVWRPPLYPELRWGGGEGRKALPPVKTEGKRAVTIEVEPARPLYRSVIVFTGRQPDGGAHEGTSPGL